MDYMGTNTLYLSAVPVLCRVFCQKVKVFMVAGNEQDCKGKLFQPIQPFVLLFASIPNPAKISADDYIIILRHSCLLGEICFPKAFKCAMGIPGSINHGDPPYVVLYHFLPDLYAAPQADQDLVIRQHLYCFHCLADQFFIPFCNLR